MEDGIVTLRNDLDIISASGTQSLSLLSQEAHQYIHAATRDNTRKAYQSDVQHFRSWGGVLPTTSEYIIAYLTAHATTLNTRTLSRRLTALRQWHVLQGFSDPTDSPMVRKTLTGIKNIHGVPKEKAPPITLEILQRLIVALQQSNRLIDVRNQTLLLIGFFGAFRRSELVTIEWEHITWSKEGIEILIPRSKTDPGGGQSCAIPYGEGLLCPVTALQRWREQGGCGSGLLFRQLSKNGSIRDDAINAHHVNIIIKALAIAARIPDAEQYSSHSLRRGFTTVASKLGAPFGAIKRQGRWEHDGTVLGYIEEGKRFESNAAGIILQNQDKV